MKMERNFDCVAKQSQRAKTALLKQPSMKNDRVRKNLPKLFKYRN